MAQGLIRPTPCYGNGASTTYSYDNGDNLTSVTQGLLGGTNFTFSYSYNGVHQRTSKTLTDIFNVFPASGSVTYGVNTTNEYNAVNTVVPTYDKNGNLTADGTFTYAYDTENRMLSASGNGHTVAYTYDAEGRLGTTTLDGTATSFDYNGTLPMGDWTGTAFATGQTQIRRHVFGAGGEPLYLTVNGVANYSHQDGLGSVVALSTATGANAGKRSALYAYDAFGQPTTTITSAFGYTGQRLDPTTGLVYDRARFYSPVLGRFVQPDPIGYRGGNNLYAYVGNDPLNLIDPSGLAAHQLGQAAYGLVQDHPQTAGAIVAGAGIIGTVGAVILTGGADAALAPEEIAASIEAGTSTTAALEGGAGAAEGAASVGGRLGNAATRAQNASIATDLESQGNTIIGGGGRLPEEYIPGAGPGTRGSTFVDITAQDNATGAITRVQTIDTLANGSPTAREAAAAGRIQSAFPNDTLQLIPKH